jgi:microcin C transport system permease protein
MSAGAFAGLTLWTKNSFLEQINQQYVLTARAKGLTERRILYGHVFRNAMLLLIGGLPSAFIGILFTGTLLIEIIFSLDGLGYLSYDALLRRDYPVLFANLYVFGLIGLLVNILGDFIYTLVDPRLDFETRDV